MASSPKAPAPYDIAVQAPPHDITAPGPAPDDLITSSSPAVLRAHEPQPGAGVQQQPSPARTRTQGPGDRGGVQGTRGQGLEQAEVGGREQDLGGGAGGTERSTRGDSAPSTQGLKGAQHLGGLSTQHLSLRGLSAAPRGGPSIAPGGIQSRTQEPGTKLSTRVTAHTAPGGKRLSAPGPLSPAPRGGLSAAPTCETMKPCA